MEDGACRGAPVSVFYPEQPDFRAARAVCRRCVVVDECLSYALDHPEVFGVWGGKSPQERETLRAERASRSSSRRQGSARTQHE